MAIAYAHSSGPDQLRRIDLLYYVSARMCKFVNRQDYAYAEPLHCHTSIQQFARFTIKKLVLQAAVPALVNSQDACGNR